MIVNWMNWLRERKKLKDKEEKIPGGKAWWWRLQNGKKTWYAGKTRLLEKMVVWAIKKDNFIQTEQFVNLNKLKIDIKHDQNPCGIGMSENGGENVMVAT